MKITAKRNGEERSSKGRGRGGLNTPPPTLPKGEGVLSSSEARAGKYSMNSKPCPGPGLSAPLRLKKKNVINP